MAININTVTIDQIAKDLSDNGITVLKDFLEKKKIRKINMLQKIQGFGSQPGKVNAKYELLSAKYCGSEEGGIEFIGEFVEQKEEVNLEPVNLSNVEIFREIAQRLDDEVTKEAIKTISAEIDAQKQFIIEKEEKCNQLEPSVVLPEKKCCSCYEEFINIPDKIAMLGCAHMICLDCVKKLAQSFNYNLGNYAVKCPMCRVEFIRDSIKVNAWLRDMIKNDPFSKAMVEIDELKKLNQARIVKRDKLIKTLDESMRIRAKIPLEQLIAQFKELKNSDNKLIKDLFA